MTESCFDAPANQSFSIVFSNQIIAANGNGLTEDLSIYKDQQTALSVSPDGQEWVANRVSAIFAGDRISAPGTVTYTIPALAPGTYYIQSDYDPDKIFGTLIVD